MRRASLCALLLVVALIVSACGGGSDATKPLVVTIPRGAGGVGFLPLLIMEQNRLVEKHAISLGLPDMQVKWVDVSGPSAMNDALLSGAVDFIAAGPPAFLVAWDRTRDSLKVMGVSAITSLPMYLNTNKDRLKRLEDLTSADKIGVTGIKTSIPAIVMQMYAAEKYGFEDFAHFDRYTVPMTHPDGVIALLGGSGGISGHFTSPPFYQRERKDPHVHTMMNTNDVMKGATTFTMLSTTTAFRTANPKAVQAVLAALEEATSNIRADKKKAAGVLLASTSESSFSLQDLTDVVEDPAVKFTTTPENVMKYAEFMHRIGTLKHLPGSWKELFFEDIHSAPGS